MEALNEFLKGKVVNCQTEDEARDLFKYLFKEEYLWINGDRLFVDDNDWNFYQQQTCYNIYAEQKMVAYASYNFYSEKGCKIITYQQFKELLK